MVMVLTALLIWQECVCVLRDPLPVNKSELLVIILLLTHSLPLVGIVHAKPSLFLS